MSLDTAVLRAKLGNGHVPIQGDRLSNVEARIAALEARLEKVMRPELGAFERTIDGRPTLRAIKRAVCATYGLTEVGIESARRAKVAARPRQIGMYIAHHLTLHSLPSIGKAFGGRDHTTVLHAVRIIQRLIETTPALDEEVRTLMATLQTQGPPPE